MLARVKVNGTRCEGAVEAAYRKAVVLVLVEKKVVDGVVFSHTCALEVERGVVFVKAFVVFESDAVDVEVGAVLTHSVNEDTAVVIGEVQSVQVECGGLFQT